MIFSQVEYSNRGRGKLQAVASGPNNRRKVIHKRDLIFYERSPNYCESDPDLAVWGTRGRVCNSTSADIDNCETMCCGRGYATLEVTKVERCNCKFHWCCYVKCDTCESVAWLTVCK